MAKTFASSCVKSWHSLVGTLPDAEVACIGGVTRSAVSTARRKRGAPSFRAQGGLRRSCTIQDCTASSYGSGLCEDHYYRLKFYGDPTHPRAHRRSGSTVGLTHKSCTMCGSDKDMSLFGSLCTALDGHTSQCLACSGEAVSPKRKHVKEFIADHKKGPCSDCGEFFPHFCMDFDHVRGSKFKNVSVMGSSRFSKSNILSEIAKCDLVCACCHRIRTKKRMPEIATARRQEFLAKLIPLKSLPCTDCGRTFTAEAMDFDHISEPKYRGIATMFGFSWDVVLAEIAKCELVCACCHRLRTEFRRSAPVITLLREVQDAVL